MNKSLDATKNQTCLSEAFKLVHENLNGCALEQTNGHEYAMTQEIEIKGP